MNSNQMVKQAIIVEQASMAKHNTAAQIALFDENGDPVKINPNGEEIVLTGYESGEAGEVAASDTVNEAIAKLEARIAALENA